VSEDPASAATNETQARANELLERGYRLQLEGRTETAAVLYRRSIELAPTALAHTFLGAALANDGLIDEAIAHCLEAIRLDPGFGNAWSDIGAYLLEKGDQGRAASYLERALGKTRFERHHYAHANMGRVHRKQGLLMQALDEFRRAVALEPRDSGAKKAIREILRNFN
jgi:tetratricopeptide (TPR) repeat protein